MAGKKKGFFAKLGENRKGGVIFLVVCVVVCIPLGMWKNVSGLERSVKKAYTENSFFYGDAEEYASKLAGYAAKLLEVCKAGDVSCAELESSLAGFKEKMSSPIGLDKSFHDLYSASSIAYETGILSDKLDDSQKSAAILYWQEIDSACKRLKNNLFYAEAAKAYNEAIETFPSSLLFGRREKAVRFD